MKDRSSLLNCFLSLSVLAMSAGLLSGTATADQNIVININGENALTEARRAPKIVQASSFRVTTCKYSDATRYVADEFKSNTVDDSDGPWQVEIGGGIRELNACIRKGGNTEQFMDLGSSVSSAEERIKSCNGTFVWSNGRYTVTVVIKRVSREEDQFYLTADGEIVISKAASGSQSSALDDLKKLGELYEKGVLTKEEFEQKKKELLAK